MWLFDFDCPCCKPRRSLRLKGIYNRVCLVLDMKDYYYLAGEYMNCLGCKGTFILLTVVAAATSVYGSIS